MNKLHTPPLAEAVDAARAWWLEAGVDCDFTDEPHNWLERKALVPSNPIEASDHDRRTLAKPKVQVPLLGGNRSDWPNCHADFAQWWLTEPLLETPGTGQRLAPRGVAGAELMVLVVRPEVGDTDKLLTGPEGNLVGNMLKAMGIAEDRAYLAAALPRHISHPDWRALAECGLGDILRHHIALAEPQRLLILGRQLLPLFGHDPAQDTAPVGQIALESVAPPILAAVDPEALLREHRFRKGLWNAWLEWTEEAK